MTDTNTKSVEKGNLLHAKDLGCSQERRWPAGHIFEACENTVLVK